VSSTAERIHIHQEHPTLHLPSPYLRTLAAGVASGEGVTIEEVAIVLADHPTVLDLNRRFLDHDYVTDVLAFPFAEDEAAGLSGEIYIDLDTAAERHEEFDATFAEEATRYIIHGLLHLCGYTDATAKDKRVMHNREDAYLQQYPPPTEL